MLDDLYIESQQAIRSLDQEYKRYFLKKHSLANKMSIIVGARGVGKTTAIVQFIRSKYNESSKEALYVSADSISMQGVSLFEIARIFAQNEGKLLAIDEIHKNPNWSQELKTIYDKLDLQVVASGSSALEITKGSHDLSRRAVVLTMNGMSFREFVELELGVNLESFTLESLLADHNKIALDITAKVEQKNRKILALFADYLQFGYYPYSREFEDKKLFEITLNQQIITTLESDFLAIYPSFSGTSVRKMRKLMSIIASSVPFTLDLKYLREASEISDDRTLKNYIYFLAKSQIVRFAYRSARGLRAMEKPEKVMLGNPNLMATLGKNSGSLRETFFLSATEDAGLEVVLADKGDFTIDQHTFEVGGKNKGSDQIKGVENSFLAVDDIEIGAGKKIPHWLFGFLY